MMKRFLLPGLLTGLALAALAMVPARADRIDKAAKPSADKLVEQLGSDSFNVRKRAYEQLASMGEAALPALEKASTSKDTEVRKKASELLAKISKQVAASRVLAPTQVHLVFKDTPVKDAVADLKKKTGFLIVLHDPENKLKDKKVTLDTGKVNFWVALEQFCDAAGLVEGDPNANNTGGGGVIGFPGGPGPRPVPRPLPPVRPGNIRPAPVKPLPAKKPAQDLPAKTEKEAPDRPVQSDPAATKEEAKKQQAEEAAKQQAAKAELKKRLQVAAQQKAVQIQVQVQGQPPIQILPAIPPGGPGAVPPMPGPGGFPPGFKPWVPVQQGQITLMPGKAKKQGADQKTSFRIRAGQHEALRAQDKEYLAVLELTHEPKVRWQSFSNVKVTKAVDANGEALTQAEEKVPMGQPGIGIGAPPLPGGPAILPIGPGGGGIAPGFPGNFVYTPTTSNGLTHFIPVRLKKGAKDAKALKELTGTVSAKVLGEAQPLVTVDNILKAKGKTVTGKDGGEIKVLDVSTNNGVTTITFEFEPAKDVIPETMIQTDEAPVARPAPGGRPARPARPVRPAQRGGAANAAGGQAGAAKVPATDEAGKKAEDARKAEEADKAKKAEEAKKPAQNNAAVDTPLVIAPANGAAPVQIVIAGQGGVGGGVVVGGGIAMPGGAARYAPYGLTLTDAKGKVLPAGISMNWQKMRGAGRVPFQPGQKMEYIATYRPAGKDAPEPAKLVYTGRRSVDVAVPFSLKDVEVK